MPPQSCADKLTGPVLAEDRQPPSLSRLPTFGLSWIHAAGASALRLVLAATVTYMPAPQAAGTSPVVGHNLQASSVAGRSRL